MQINKKRSTKKIGKAYRKKQKLKRLRRPHRKLLKKR